MHTSLLNYRCPDHMYIIMTPLRRSLVKAGISNTKNIFHISDGQQKSFGAAERAALLAGMDEVSEKSEGDEEEFSVIGRKLQNISSSDRAIPEDFPYLDEEMQEKIVQAKNLAATGSGRRGAGRSTVRDLQQQLFFEGGHSAAFPDDDAERRGEADSTGRRGSGSGGAGIV